MRCGSVVIPGLIAQRQDTRKMSFWSAASSSGQEAYSLAMMLLRNGTGRLENQDPGHRPVRPDGRTRAARADICRSKSTAACRSAICVKYFTRAGLEWQLKDEVRRMVDFTTFDLRQSMSARGPFDVVFCRNVLIYFDVEAKRKILDEIHGTLFRGGYLLLGGSETTLNLTTRFERKNTRPNGSLPGSLKG